MFGWRCDDVFHKNVMMYVTLASRAAAAAAAGWLLVQCLWQVDWQAGTLLFLPTPPPPSIARLH